MLTFSTLYPVIIPVNEERKQSVAAILNNPFGLTLSHTSLVITEVLDLLIKQYSLHLC